MQSSVPCGKNASTKRLHFQKSRAKIPLLMSGSLKILPLNKFFGFEFFGFLFIEEVLGKVKLSEFAGDFKVVILGVIVVVEIGDKVEEKKLQSPTLQVSVRDK